MALPYCTPAQAEKIAKEEASKIGGGTVVIANPSLVGTEAILSGLQVDNTKFKVKDITFSPFPSGDPAQHKGFKTNGTTVEFGQSVVNYENFKAGYAWHGEITCSDLPSGLSNVECNVTALTDGIALVELSSSNRAPYYWQYNTDSWNRGTGNNDWKYVAAIDGSKMPSSAGTYAIKCTHQGDENIFKTVTDTAPELSSIADDGTYTLKATKSGSSITYTWVKDQ